MASLSKPSAWTGVLVGVLLMAPILALAYLGERLVGLSLFPLDFFDFIVPLIPGGVITLVIDVMVSAIIALGLGESVDTIAKTVEQAMGFGMVLGLAGGVGAAFFGFGERYRERGPVVGGAVGLVLGLVFAVFAASSPFIAVSPVLAAAWVVVLFVGWGLALGWVFSDMTTMPMSGQVESADDEVQPRVEQIGRREFLIRIGGATATLTLVGAGLGLALGADESAPTTVANNDTTLQPGATGASTEPAQPQTTRADTLPNAGAKPEPAPGMRPEYTPVEDHYRIDIASRPISIDLATWALPFSGLVAEEVSFTMDQLRNDYEAREQHVTMQCISNRIGGNLISTTRWTGVPVRDVLADVDLAEDAAWLLIEGGDNFFEYVSIEMIMNDPDIMFTYDFDGQPLPERNGFPLRIYIPDRYGMKQPKWINNIVVTRTDELGYWVRRGWSAEAIMQTSSVVDTIATDSIYKDEDGTMRVPIGGYAVAGARGISKVEISIDDGEWIEAELRQPLSDKTWVFWRYDWAFETGEFTFSVRCYEGNGDLQPTVEQGVRPDGATGINSERATLPDPTSV